MGIPVLLASAVALATALAVVLVAFAIARLRGRYDTIDSAWGAGFAVIGVVTLVLATTGFAGLRYAGAVAIVVTVLTAVWGLRLSVHIHRRNAGQAEDPRYQAIVARAGDNPALRVFVRVYLTQAVAMWFVSLPVQFAQYDLSPIGGSPSYALSWVGVALWIVGMLFEVVGDSQLRRFKSDPGNEGEVLESGLWRYTRHPNYFGDACVWWGLYLLACHQIFGAATILSPILMTWLLAAGSGKPLLERHMREKRPGYADYVERTSGFFPLPPRRSARNVR